MKLLADYGDRKKSYEASVKLRSIKLRKVKRNYEAVGDVLVVGCKEVGGDKEGRRRKEGKGLGGRLTF